MEAEVDIKARVAGVGMECWQRKTAKDKRHSETAFRLLVHGLRGRIGQRQNCECRCAKQGQFTQNHACFYPRHCCYCYHTFTATFFSLKKAHHAPSLSASTPSLLHLLFFPQSRALFAIVILHCSPRHNSFTKPIVHHTLIHASHCRPCT